MRVPSMRAKWKDISGRTEHWELRHAGFALADVEIGDVCPHRWFATVCLPGGEPVDVGDYATLAVAKAQVVKQIRNWRALLNKALSA